jgi:biopolymer transport protein ExbB/TolQ
VLALQLLLLAGVLALAARKVGELAGGGVIDADRLLRRVAEHLEDDLAAYLEPARGTYAGEIVRALLCESPGDFDLAVESSFVAARERLNSSLLMLRVLATSSTFLGFLGAALAFAWVRSGEHGLLDLDPSRVAHEGLRMAARAMALGIAGSVLALGFFATLRKQARRVERECERVVERVRALGAGKQWTRASGE